MDASSIPDINTDDSNYCQVNIHVFPEIFLIISDPIMIYSDDQSIIQGLLRLLRKILGFDMGQGEGRGRAGRHE
jgi:hypothetical protein